MNDLLKEALKTGKYPCPECKELMVFEDEQWRDSLVCENCGYSCNLDEYGLDYDEIESRRLSEIAGCKSEEDYDELYGDDDD